MLDVGSCAWRCASATEMPADITCKAAVQQNMEQSVRPAIEGQTYERDEVTARLAAFPGLGLCHSTHMMTYQSRRSRCQAR